MLLMLEGDPERVERFAAVLRNLDPDMPLRIWKNAHALIREAGPLLEQSSIISLDHDLEPEPNAPDPGDGYLVAQWLVMQPWSRPVVVHSSNVERARWMAGAFDLAGWRHWRVAPIGDDWIELDWRRTIRRLIAMTPGRTPESKSRVSDPQSISGDQTPRPPLP